MQKQRTIALIAILLTWLTLHGCAINSPSIFHQKAKTVNQQSNKSVSSYKEDINATLSYLSKKSKKKEPFEKKDFDFLERACSIGIAQACFILGNMYKDGLGVSKDYKKAIELFSKACNSGDAL